MHNETYYYRLGSSLTIVSPQKLLKVIMYENPFKNSSMSGFILVF